jgi:hypothetical protein
MKRRNAETLQAGKHHLPYSAEFKEQALSKAWQRGARDAGVRGQRVGHVARNAEAVAGVLNSDE